jgi:hypothetical protein
MELPKIAENFTVNDNEINQSTLNTLSIALNGTNTTEQEYTNLSFSIIYCLWKLPKFSVQTQFCKSLLTEILKLDGTKKQKFLSILFLAIIREWKGIESNRKDKFYFLVELLISHVLSQNGLRYLFELDCQVDLKNFIIKKSLDFLSSAEVETLHFIVEFIGRCENRSTLLVLKDLGTKIFLNASKEVVDKLFEVGSAKNTAEYNREVLYHIYVNSRR